MKLKLKKGDLAVLTHGLEVDKENWMHYAFPAGTVVFISNAPTCRGDNWYTAYAFDPIEGEFINIHPTDKGARNDKTKKQGGWGGFYPCTKHTKQEVCPEIQLVKDLFDQLPEGTWYYHALYDAQVILGHMDTDGNRIPKEQRV